MKKFTPFASLRNLVLVSIAVVLFSSCGDDEKPSNSLKVDGNTLKLKNAYIIYSAGSDEGEEYNENMGFITTDGLTYNYDEDEFVGTGDMIFFYLVSEGLTLQKDTYELDNPPGIGDLMVFQVGISIEDGEPTEAFYGATDGEMEVTSVSSNKITLEFDFDEYEFETTTDGGTRQEKLSGYFSGKVEFFDETGTPSRKAGKIKEFLKLK